MNNNAYIITYRFFDFERNAIRIGGIETYTYDLALLLKDLKYDVCVYTLLKNRESRNGNFNGIKIVEIDASKGNNASFQSLYRIAPEALYIIMTDGMRINSSGMQNVITIQHGISWDFPRWAMNKVFQKIDIAYRIRKMQICNKQVRLFLKATNYVCVDYNYYNWLRTLYDISNNRIVTVIPNYAQGISREEFELKINAQHDMSKAKIVFARRMTRYRGALLFADVVKRLLQNYPEISVTFAGDGELTTSVREQFANYPNVAFTTYQPYESIEFHKQFDIAVVPTIYSEGTSLSLCEAMAAGCMPVATHVGGMTNMILDGYNGFLCYPSEDAFYNKLKTILDMDEVEYRRVLRNSYETAMIGFSKTLWKGRWGKLIKTISEKYV